MSLAVFFQRLIRNWKAIVLCLVAWLFAGVAFFYLYPAKWEAQGYVRLGQIARRPLESAAAASARLGSYGTLKRVMESLGEGDDDDKIAAFRSAMQVQKVDDRVVFIKIRAKSRELAAKRLQALVDEFAGQHAAIYKDALDSLNEALIDIDSSKKKLENDAFKSANRVDDFFSGTVTSKIADLDGQRRELAILLKRPSTEGTVLQETIYVTNDPVFPKLGLVLFVCILLGIASALVYIFSDGPNVKSART